MDRDAPSSASPPETPPTPAQLTDRYWELAKRIDTFFDGVHQRQASRMQCSSGCSDCCLVDLTVTGVEAAVVAEGIVAMPHDTRAALDERSRRAASKRCVALDADDRCAIYAHRPLVCRSHGVPVKVASAASQDRVQLPVIEVCPRNFRAVDSDGDGGLESLPTSDVLNQNTLSTILGIVDSLFADATGRERGDRVALRSVVGHPEHYRV